jgi:NAD(P)-dependent dehydrogenase (short-subunit alcohol dehydrogenase family)
MSSFANRVVLITGAGSGIGRRLALTFAAEGAVVAALDLNPRPLEALAAELPAGRGATAVADVTDLDGLRRAVAGLESRVGPTDVLIANAGIGRETSALSFRAEDFAAQVQVNLIGVANSIDAVLPGMRQRRSGHLVGISSLASYRGLPRMAGYCAGKAGVNSLMDAMRTELRPLGIAVTTICPGWIRTPLTADIPVPKPDMMEVEYAVGRMVAAIRKRRSFVAFPASTTWQLRVLRWLPCGWGDRLALRALCRLEKKA